METEPLRDSVAQYSLTVKSEQRLGETVWLAWYAEAPGCMAEAGSREAVLEELDALIVPFLEGMLAEGGRLPKPLSERPRRPITNIVNVSNVIVGTVSDLMGAGKLGSGDHTSLSEPARLEQGQLISA